MQRVPEGGQVRRPSVAGATIQEVHSLIAARCASVHSAALAPPACSEQSKTASSHHAQCFPTGKSGHYSNSRLCMQMSQSQCQVMQAAETQTDRMPSRGQQPFTCPWKQSLHLLIFLMRSSMAACMSVLYGFSSPFSIRAQRTSPQKSGRREGRVNEDSA